MKRLNQCVQNERSPLFLLKGKQKGALKRNNDESTSKPTA